jgi:hypothetical protein
VFLVIHGFRAMRAQPKGTRVDLPVSAKNGLAAHRNTARRDLWADWRGSPRLTGCAKDWRSKAWRCNRAYRALTLTTILAPSRQLILPRDPVWEVLIKNFFARAQRAKKMLNLGLPSNQTVGWTPDRKA